MPNGRSWDSVTTFKKTGIGLLMECDGYLFAVASGALFRSGNKGQTWVLPA